MKLILFSKNHILKYLVIFVFTLLISNLGLYSLSFQQVNGSISNDPKNTNGQPYNGVNMHGFYTRTAQARDTNYDLPDNYFDESFKILSDNGLNHVRFLVFWESFIKN